MKKETNAQRFENEVFEYLDRLRESGITNMYGACPYIMVAFGTDHTEAQVLLMKWMKTFSERHAIEKE